MTTSFIRFFHGRDDMLSMGIRVLACGRADAAYYRQRSADRPRIVHRFILALLAGGAGFLDAQLLGRRRIRRGSYWLLSPHEDFGYEPDQEDPWMVHWCSFDGPAIQQASAQGRFPTGQALGSLPDDSEIPEAFDKLLRLGRSQNLQWERQMPGLLHHLLDGMFPAAPAPPADGQGYLQRILEQIRANPQREWDFRQLAVQEGVSYSLLRMRFRRFTGQPPHQFLLRLRVNRACEYLTRGASVKEAAFGVGVSDPYYFSRLFKRVTSISPSDYARRKRS
jgi:AraC-like DNA-binding protein